MGGDSIGREYMFGEGVELRRTVAEEIGQGHRREGMGVGVVGSMFEDHLAVQVALSRMRVEIQCSRSRRNGCQWVDR